MNWFTNFDIAKATIIAVLAILTSWYDLRGEVTTLKQVVAQDRATQERTDMRQDVQVDELRADIRQGFSDLRSDLRAKK